MRRVIWNSAVGLFLSLISGCLSGPLLENPLALEPQVPLVENPVYVPMGPGSYNAVFEKILDVVDGYFEISYSNRYSGEIVTYPRIAPGLEQPWKPGSPDFNQRLEATLQTIRHRAEVKIQPAPDGGFFVQVVVHKELEDLPRPTRATPGAASFRTENTVDRQFEVIDPTVFESNWIPLGRNMPLEQALLQQIKKCM